MKTKAQQRFEKYLERVKAAASDIMFLDAAFDLLNEYRAFRSQKHASQVYNILVEEICGYKQEGK